jgi:hypothetical protein
MAEDTSRRQIRKDGKYNAEERKVIKPYKEAFTTERRVAGRLQILRNHILPAIFNHWEKVGNRAKDQDESRQRAKVSFGNMTLIVLIVQEGTYKLALQQLENATRFIQEIKWVLRQEN